MWHPALLSLIIAETRTNDTPTALFKHKDEITKLEQEAGVYKNKHFQDTLNPDTLAPSEARDFGNIMNGLIPIRASSDYLFSKGQNCLYFLDFIKKVAEDFESAYPNKGALADVEKRCFSACNSKIAFQRTYTSNTQSRCQYIIDRAAALANQVCRIGSLG
jgi:hypothetical protein